MRSHQNQISLDAGAQLLPLIEHIKAYDKEISELFLTHADSQIFERLLGAGKCLAPQLLAEWGTITTAIHSGSERFPRLDSFLDWSIMDT